MPAKKNTAPIATVPCTGGCGEQMQVFQNVRTDLYTRCPVCRCNQANGPAPQRTMWEALPADVQASIPRPRNLPNSKPEPAPAPIGVPEPAPAPVPTPIGDPAPEPAPEPEKPAKRPRGLFALVLAALAGAVILL